MPAKTFSLFHNHAFTGFPKWISEEKTVIGATERLNHSAPAHWAAGTRR
jgi:hypothetical protein